MALIKVPQTLVDKDMVKENVHGWMEPPIQEIGKMIKDMEKVSLLSRTVTNTWVASKMIYNMARVLPYIQKDIPSNVHGKMEEFTEQDSLLELIRRDMKECGTMI